VVPSAKGLSQHKVWELCTAFCLQFADQPGTLHGPIELIWSREWLEPFVFLFRARPQGHNEDVKAGIEDRWSICGVNQGAIGDKPRLAARAFDRRDDVEEAGMQKGLSFSDEDHITDTKARKLPAEPLNQLKANVGHAGIAKPGCR
jgi:hypothetical protein